MQAKYDVSQIGHRNIGSGLDFYSIDREIALGHQLAGEVEQNTKLVTDPIINEYINRIGQNLVRNSDARVPFTIKVLDTDEVNAFALPGGFFYVNSGLILAADDEAELAGVMAHEIAHVAARHATKNMTRAQIWNMASVPLIFIGGPAAYIISEVASIAVPMTYLKFSRDAEREADLLGLEYDYAAGYDPHAFVEFFEKLNVDGKKKHSALAKAFATHPMTADRIQAAQDEIRKYLPDRPEYLVDTSEFENVKARLISLENGRRLGGGKSGGRKPPRAAEAQQHIFLGQQRFRRIVGSGQQYNGPTGRRSALRSSAIRPIRTDLWAFQRYSSAGSSLPGQPGNSSRAQHAIKRPIHFGTLSKRYPLNPRVISISLGYR